MKRHAPGRTMAFAVVLAAAAVAGLGSAAPAATPRQVAQIRQLIQKAIAEENEALDWMKEYVRGYERTGHRDASDLRDAADSLRESQVRLSDAIEKSRNAKLSSVFRLLLLRAHYLDGQAADAARQGETRRASRLVSEATKLKQVARAELGSP